jgi:hypothetical protein
VDIRRAFTGAKKNTGWVLVLIIALFGGAYFGGGYFHLKINKEQPAGERIMHKEFWLSILPLAKDGCQYCKGKVFGGGNSGGSSAGDSYNSL